MPDTNTVALHVNVREHYLRDDDQQRINDWLRGLILDPAKSVALAVIGNDDGWMLHVTEKMVDAKGGDIIDQALGELYTRPRKLPLGTRKTWPQGVVTWKKDDARTTYPEAA